MEASANVVQLVDVLEREDDKWQWLSKRANSMLAKAQLLVFVKSIDVAEELNQNFCDFLGKKSECIHDALDAPERLRIISAFQQKDLELLVATDGVARLFFSADSNIVVSYDAPTDIAAHLLRVGHAGSGGSAGEAFTLLTQEGDDRKFATDLIEHFTQIEHPVSDSLKALPSASKLSALPVDESSSDCDGLSAPGLIQPFGLGAISSAKIVAPLASAQPASGQEQATPAAHSKASPSVQQAWGTHQIAQPIPSQQAHGWQQSQQDLATGMADLATRISQNPEKEQAWQQAQPLQQQQPQETWGEPCSWQQSETWSIPQPAEPAIGKSVFTLKDIRAMQDAKAKEKALQPAQPSQQQQPQETWGHSGSGMNGSTPSVATPLIDPSRIIAMRSISSAPAVQTSPASCALTMADQSAAPLFEPTLSPAVQIATAQLADSAIVSLPENEPLTSFQEQFFKSQSSDIHKAMKKPRRSRSISSTSSESLARRKRARDQVQVQP